MRIPIILCALALSGCATSDYKLYADAQAKVEAARYNADAAKYKAMADIAAQGDASAKVAAVMAIAMGGAQNQAQSTQLRPPEHPTGTALQWAGVLVPGLTQIAGMHYNYRSALAQSNNSARVAESTNGAFVSIASQIQAPAAPAPNITTTTNTTTTDRHDVTTSTAMTNSTGVLGSGTYNPVTTTTTTPAPVVITPVVQVVPVSPAPAPIVPTVITPVVQVVPVINNP